MAPPNDPEHDDDDQSDDLEMSPEEADRLLDDDSDDPDEPAPRKRRRDEAEDDEEDSGLGDRGRRALEAMKQQRKAARLERDRAKQQLEETKRELAKLQDGNKSELQRLIDERDALREQLQQVGSVAKRREVAESVAPDHATPKQIRLVAKYLAGASEDELEEAAEELFDQFAPPPPAVEEKKVRTPARPKERLRGGSDPEEDDGPSDPRALADLIRKNR